MIPKLMTSISGQKIDTVEKWEKFRRPEILNLFSEYVYGVRPKESVPDIKFNVIFEKRFEREGILLQKVEISFMDYSFCVYGYMPCYTEGKIPAFINIMHEAYEKQCDLYSIDCKFVPIKKIIDSGYAVFIMPTSGIYPDWEARAEYLKGIFPVFTPDANERRDDSWATISAWAFGASRVLDYIQTLDEIDENRITVVGHSRCGKTALWAAATDDRFYCAVSNNSGCAGAAMQRTKGGERIKDINITDWFCKNYRKFNDNEEMLPVDQHMLIALLAPRLCYVSSSKDDTWSDPTAERLSCQMANEAYKLYNKSGVVFPDDSSETVDVNVAYHDGNIGYHVKEGEHSITDYDWEMFIDFLNKKTI